MKKLFFAFLAAWLIVSTPLFAQPWPANGTRPAPDRLRVAQPTVVMSGLNAGSDLPPMRLNLAEGVLPVHPLGQGQVGACAAWATAQSMTLMLRRQERLPVSDRSWRNPMFLYYFTVVGYDTGSYVHENMERARLTGISTVLTHQLTQNWRLRPNARAMREAAGARIQSWHRIQNNCVDTLRSFLVQGHPIVLVHRVHDSFHSYRGGIYYPEGPARSYHAILAVGFGYCTAGRHATPYIIAINSWNPQWGEQGKIRLSERSIRNSNFLLAAYIMVLPETQAGPAFPTEIRASRGASSSGVTVRWTSNGSGLEYEVLRLCEEGQYVSIGTTRGSHIVDSSARLGRRYFFLVRAIDNQAAGAFSFPVEGWLGGGSNSPPGIPSGLTATQENDTVVLRWDSIENSYRYRVYAFNGTDWVRTGETTANRFVYPSPVRRQGSSTLSFFVIAVNNFGQSLPSDAASVAFEWGGNDDSGLDVGGNEIHYRGDFYVFPARRFQDLERMFFEAFERNAREFRQSFDARQRHFSENFNNMRGRR